MQSIKRWCAGVVLALSTCAVEGATTGGAFVAGVMGGELTRAAVTRTTADAGAVLACR